MGRLMLEAVVSIVGSLTGAALTWYIALTMFSQDWEFRTVWIIWISLIFLSVMAFRVSDGDLD